MVEERIRVEKREVVSGRVRISTITDHVEDVVREELRGTRAEVVRVSIGRTLGPDEAVPGPRTEGNVTIIPVFEEIVVVEKRLLKEELHVSQLTVAEDFEIPVTKEARVTEEITIGKDVEDRTETVHDKVRHTGVRTGTVFRAAVTQRTAQAYLEMSDS